MVEVRDIVLGLVSSVIAGSAVWLGQRLLRYRRVARKRAFFGVVPAADCVLVPPRHFSSPHPHSVHRRDTATLVELATAVNGCGGRAEIADEPAGWHQIGRATEFCVGGPSANRRTGTHLRSLLPGVRFAPPDDDPHGEVDFEVGPTVYRRTPQQDEYVVLARIHLSTPNARPVFVLAGQTAVTNLAAARFLVAQHGKLLRTYGTSGQFCLVLRVVEPEIYGPDLVEIAADATDHAFRAQDPPTAARTSSEASKLA